MEDKIKSIINRIKLFLGIISLVFILISYIVSTSNYEEIIKEISIALAVSFSVSFALTVVFQITITKIFVTYNQLVEMKIEDSFNKYIENQNIYHDKVYHQIINHFSSPPPDSYESDLTKIMRSAHTIKTILQPTKEYVEENIATFGHSSFTVGGTTHFYDRHEDEIIKNIETIIKQIEEMIIAFIPYEIKNRYNTDGIKNVKNKLNLQTLVNGLKVDKDNLHKIMSKYNIDKNRFFLREDNLRSLLTYIEITLQTIDDGLKKVSSVSNMAD